MCFWTIYSSQNPEKKTDFSFDIIKKRWKNIANTKLLNGNFYNY